MRFCVVHHNNQLRIWLQERHPHNESCVLNGVLPTENSGKGLLLDSKLYSPLKCLLFAPNILGELDL